MADTLVLMADTLVLMADTLASRYQSAPGSAVAGPCLSGVLAVRGTPRVVEQDPES
jgi:hypothetical protein